MSRILTEAARSPVGVLDPSVSRQGLDCGWTKSGPAKGHLPPCPKLKCGNGQSQTTSLNAATLPGADLSDSEFLGSDLRNPHCQKQPTASCSDSPSASRSNGKARHGSTPPSTGAARAPTASHPPAPLQMKATATTTAPGSSMTGENGCSGDRPPAHRQGRAATTLRGLSRRLSTRRKLGSSPS